MQRRVHPFPCRVSSLITLVAATVLLALFAIDLPDLGGRAALEADGVATTALLEFSGN